MIMRGRKLNSVRDLKANFSIDELVYIYYSGELEIWLNNIGEKSKAKKLSRISSNNAQLLVELYKVFDLNPALTEEEVRRKYG
ncbi:MAG: hypothetical protein J6A30_09160 [Ruminococcus sp.]|nr:hypothetical protein [Ruminococcus sp.]